MNDLANDTGRTPAFGSSVARFSGQLFIVSEDLLEVTRRMQHATSFNSLTLKLFNA